MPMATSFVMMGMFVRVVGPVLVSVAMHRANGGKLMHFVRVGPAQVVVMVMTTPEMLRVVIGNQQTLAMMPTGTENVIVLLALRCSFLVAQAFPLTVQMLLNSFNYPGCGKDTIARSFEEKAIED